MGLSAKNLHPWPRLETPGGERECGAPPLEPGNWWASSSSLRSRFSPPPPRSFSLPLVPHRDRRQKAIVPPRISPLPTHLFSPPRRAEEPTSPIIAAACPTSSHPPRYNPHTPPPLPPSSLRSPPSNPIQSAPSRLPDAAKSVWGAIGSLGRS